MSRLRRTVLIFAFVAWMAGWFRSFSLQFSSGFFDHHLNTRAPFLLIALLAVAVPPLSGYWAVTRAVCQKVGAVQAAAAILAISAVPVFVRS